MRRASSKFGPQGVSRRHRAARFWGHVLWVAAVALSGGGWDCTADETLFTARMAAGEFGPALAMAAAQEDPVQRDAWLQRVSLAQLGAGARFAAVQTAGGIQDDGVRAGTYGAVASQPLGAARGGAAMADFDTLIELITSTVAPDSWDAVGGPGAIESFPTGVAVDPSGLLLRVTPPSDSELADLHRTARRLEANREARKFSPLRKVSLPRLEQEAQRLWALGEQPDATMRTLAGLRRVQYLLVYPETRDVVLAGPAGDWISDAEGRLVGVEDGCPVVQLDDLVTVLRNAFSEHQGRFGCSIAPRDANLAAVQQFLQDSAARPLKPGQRDAWINELRSRLGKQDIRVYGIDPRSRAARTIVEADYHMKLIGMGLAGGTLGVPSYLEAVELNADGSPPPMDVLRWWFTLNYEAVRTTPQRNAFELHGPGVKVQSENELLAERGRRIHTGVSDPKNQKFAHDFTKHFPQLAQKYRVYGELRNLFDLAVAAALLRSQKLAEQAAWRLPFFGDDGKYQVDYGFAPTEVESVVNYRLLNQRQFVVGVSGGVAVDPEQWLDQETLVTDVSLRSKIEQSQAAAAELPRPVWWWD